MPELVQSLSDAGVPLYIISNFGAELWSRFRPTQPIFDLFDGIVISGEEKMAKPDPTIYQLTLDRYGLDPAQTLFLDDRADNIVACESVGIAGHVFTDSNGARDWLREQGVLVP